MPLPSFANICGSRRKMCRFLHILGITKIRNGEMEELDMAQSGIIKEADLTGCHRKCTYILAYFRSRKLSVGDKWSYAEYMEWIDSQHKNFREENNIPTEVSYWQGHNDDIYRQFLQYIGYEHELSYAG
jgi:hypothetical protein